MCYIDSRSSVPLYTVVSLRSQQLPTVIRAALIAVDLAIPNLEPEWKEQHTASKFKCSKINQTLEKGFGIWKRALTRTRLSLEYKETVS